MRNAVKIVDFSYPKFYRKRGELLRDLNETDPSPSKRKEILEELKELEEEKKRLAEEAEKRRAEFLAKANEIITAMEGKERGEIKAKLHEAKIPEVIIKEVLPVEGVPGVAPAEGEAPAEGVEAPAKEEAAPKEEPKEKK